MEIMRFGNEGNGSCGVMAINDAFTSLWDNQKYRSIDQDTRLAACYKLRTAAAARLQQDGPSGNFWVRHGASLKETFKQSVNNLLDPNYRLKDVHLRLIAENLQVNILLLSCSMHGGESVQSRVVVRHHAYNLTDSEHANTVILYHRGGGGGDFGGGHYEAVVSREFGSSSWRGVLRQGHQLHQALVEAAENLY
mmetsp:Transcript_27359/g.53793  ORF Transcript_27359/g.53793 Transcript_27359/m.53793 type:complete len:194 (+) Transcript_27359:638-1219(+)